MAEAKFVIDEAGQDHNVINLQFSPSPPAAVERGRSVRTDRSDAARFFLVAGRRRLVRTARNVEEASLAQSQTSWDSLTANS